MDPGHRIPHDDWADQDLLTRTEAAERLAAEIAQVSAVVETTTADEITLRRLGALKQLHAQLTNQHERD